MLGHRFELLGRVSEYAPNRRFALETTSGPVRIEAELAFEPIPEGTRGTLTIRPDRVTADFVTTVNVIGGTRQYEDATGQIVAPGVLDLVTGSTSGTYSGTIYLG